MRVISFCVLCAAFFCFPASAQKGEQIEKPRVQIVQDDAAFAALHQKYLAEEKLQLERPSGEKEPETPPRRWRLPQWLVSFFNALGPVLQFFFYIGIGAIVAFILYFMFGALRQVNLEDFRNKKATGKAGDDVLAPSLQPDARTARSLLEEADALAREGKYAEAVHLLMFRSIEDIQTRRKQRLSTALTAREIGKLDDLPAKPRAALHPIIALVERSFFGGRPVDEPDWQSARRAYEAFAFGEAWI